MLEEVSLAATVLDHADSSLLTLTHPPVAGAFGGKEVLVLIEVLPSYAYFGGVGRDPFLPPHLPNCLSLSGYACPFFTALYLWVGGGEVTGASSSNLQLMLDFVVLDPL